VLVVGLARRDLTYNVIEDDACLIQLLVEFVNDVG